MSASPTIMRAYVGFGFIIQFVGECKEKCRLDCAADSTRRTALKKTGALAAALSALERVGPFSFSPQRADAATRPSDIQFDISAFLAVPPRTYGSGVPFQMPPVHTIFLTAALERAPTRADQAEMNRALDTLEQSYPWSAAHLVTFVAYGLPYFDRLPGGRTPRPAPCAPPPLVPSQPAPAPPPTGRCTTCTPPPT